MPRKLQPCGSPAAARRHQRAGDESCEACKKAHSKANAAAYMRGARKKQRDLVQMRKRSVERATSALISRHMNEYQNLYRTAMLQESMKANKP